MRPVTYNLKYKKTDSNQFYKELELFTDDLVNDIKSRYHFVLKDYQKFLSVNCVEKVRHADEYLLEMLMLGVFWKQYNNRLFAVNRLVYPLFKLLYFLRMKFQILKPFIDRFRGYLATIILERKQAGKEITVHNIKNLLDWMDCTNEFNDEVKRLRNWLNYMRNSSPENTCFLLSGIENVATTFEEKATAKLSPYTGQVNSFLASDHKEYRYRENYFFTGRGEIEYHLNMVGAEILNRVLKADFDRTRKQTVLLPTCMSSGKPCKAQKKGTDITCTHCSANCKVSRITRQLHSKGVRTVLIPHSSKFTKWLNPYADQSETGLVGVACVLNLLKGGYEMNNLNIPSQCVFLDYCGCKKHWHKEGLATDLNENQLDVILRKNVLSETISGMKSVEAG